MGDFSKKDRDNTPSETESGQASGPGGVEKRLILFVCTGNICRSPMAEAMFRELVKETPGYEVLSAGVGAMDGRSASEFSVEALRRRGISLPGFQSRSLTRDLVEKAAFIFVMTRSHLEVVLANFPSAAEKTFLLREFEENADSYSIDIPDPYGGSLEHYLATAESIEQALPSVKTFIEENMSTETDTPTAIPEENPTSAPAAPSGFLQETDPEIYKAIRAERSRQMENIELIASENFTSAAVMEAQGSVLTNKYAEGYPGARWYGGCEHVDVVEQLAIDRAKELFDAEFVNVQPHSGSQANTAVYFAVLKPGDKILTMDLSHGGHLTHGHKANLSGRLYDVTHYGVSQETQTIDYDALAKQAEEVKPKMITAGASAYPRVIDFQKMREIADSVGAYLFVDMAHISGLVAGGVHPTPVGIADFVTTTTHKSLRGPRGGIILCKEEYGKKINSRVFPCIQGGPLMHVIAAKAVCFKEALEPEFKNYQKQIVTNAQALAGRLQENGWTIVSGGTDNHLMLVDVRPQGLNGKAAQEALDKAAITVNKNSIPFDTESIQLNGGLRLGTPAVTSRGMKEAEMRQIADFIHRVLSKIDDAGVAEQTRKEVLELNEKFPLNYP